MTKRGGKMSLIINNCKSCPEFNIGCNGESKQCMCRECPRNLGKCITTRYCSETESVLD